MAKAKRKANKADDKLSNLHPGDSILIDYDEANEIQTPKGFTRHNTTRGALFRKADK